MFSSVKRPAFRAVVLTLVSMGLFFGVQLTHYKYLDTRLLASPTSAIPSPPANDTVTNYLETPIKEGTISPDMYISQGYAIFDIENDAYLSFIYFIFDETNLKAELTLSLQPDDDGWYANSFHIVEKCEIAATLKMVLDNNIPISVVAIDNEDPRILLCTKDGWGAVIYPEYGASEAFDVYDARFLPVAVVGAKSIDLTILSNG